MIARLVYFLARMAALAGGGVLLLLVGLIVLSVTGRALVPIGMQPVPGDFELVEIGIAFAVFAFLPWCHLCDGHAKVDLLADRLCPAARHALSALAEVLMLAAAAFIAWRLAAGMADKRLDHETTYILQLPLWWAYAAALAGAVVFVIVAAWSLWYSITGRDRPRA